MWEERLVSAPAQECLLPYFPLLPRSCSLKDRCSSALSWRFVVSLPGVCRASQGALRCRGVCCVPVFKWHLLLPRGLCEGPVHQSTVHKREAWGPILRAEGFLWGGHFSFSSCLHAWNTGRKWGELLWRHMWHRILPLIFVGNKMVFNNSVYGALFLTRLIGLWVFFCFLFFCFFFKKTFSAFVSLHEFATHNFLLWLFHFLSCFLISFRELITRLSFHPALTICGQISGNSFDSRTNSCKVLNWIAFSPQWKSPWREAGEEHFKNQICNCCRIFWRWQ